MLGGGDGEITLDSDGFRNGFSYLFKRFVEIRKLGGQAVPRGHDLFQSGQRGIAGIAEQFLQSVLVRLDYLLVVFVGFKERAAPFRGVLVKVLVPDLVQGGVIFLFGDLLGFQLKFQLGFLVGVCLFAGCGCFLGCLFRLLFSFLVGFLLGFKLLLVRLFLILCQLIAVLFYLKGSVVPLVGLNGIDEVLVPERFELAVIGGSIDLAEFVFLFHLVPYGLKFFLLGFDVDEVASFL